MTSKIQPLDTGKGARMNTLLQEALSVKVPLRFSADGKFRILMVSDIHGGCGYDADRTIRALDALIDRYTPGLVNWAATFAVPGKSISKRQRSCGSS